MSRTLTIDNLTVEARNASGAWSPIVCRVRLGIDRGEVVALIGESGAGKTTVALASLGYTRPGTRIATGRVYLDGTDLLALGAAGRRMLRGRRMAYVPQSAATALNPAIRLGEQVAESPFVSGALDRQAALRRAVELFDRLKLPDPPGLARRYPHQVSGGQQQRVMLAMAMICSPELLVLDEPTTALDVATQIEVLKAIKGIIRENNSAGLYVSHDLAVVVQMADRIMVMRHGQIVEEGPTEEILRAPREAYTRLLLDAVLPPPGRAVRVQKDEKEAIPLRERVLDAKGIWAVYGKRPSSRQLSAGGHTLREVSFTVARGEVVALVGESGSGKTTLARVVAGLHAPVSGSITFEGKPLHAVVRGRSREQLRKIQIVFQSPDASLNPTQSIGDAIARPLQLYFGLGGRALHDRVAELLTMVRLSPDFAVRYPPELSGGEKQRVSLARAFAAEPDLILCDEVLASLDMSVRTSVLELLRELQAHLHVAYLFITHDLSTVVSIADRVAVLYGGSLLEAGPTQEVFSPPQHPYTTMLMSSVPELRQGWLAQVADSKPGLPPRDALCPFRSRCLLIIDGVCNREPAPIREVGKDHHILACHRQIEELDIKRPMEMAATAGAG